MVHTRELTMAIMAAQMKNARIYEYLLGALLESEDRTRELEAMLEYKRKTETYKDNIDGESTGDGCSEQSAILKKEVALNRELIQSVRRCESELWVKHGYGLPVMRCASKWAYQDFPGMLSRMHAVYQPLTVLCKHVTDKYDCTRDAIITELCNRPDEGKAIPTPPNPGVTEPASEECTEGKNDDTRDLADASDDETSLVVAEETSYPRVARESRHDENDSGETEDSLKASSLVIATRKAGIDAVWEERILSLKATVTKALAELIPTLCPSSNTRLQEDIALLQSSTDENQSAETTTYWPHDNEETSKSTITLNNNFRTFVMQRKPNFMSRRHLARPLPSTSGSVAVLTPLDPEYGTSPCSVRASRMTPLRAPVKKVKRAVFEFHFEEVRDDVPSVELGPFVKPQFKKRVSHVQHIAGSGEEPYNKWNIFHAHLEVVRQRVVKKLTEKVSKPAHKRAAPKQRKRKRKSRCRRKCKKHTKTERTTSRSSSSVSLKCKSQHGDEPQMNDVTSGEIAGVVDTDAIPRKRQSSAKDKKRKRRPKKTRIIPQSS